MSNGFRGSCLDSHSSIAHTQSTQVRRTRRTQPCVWSERRVSVAERTAQMNSLNIDDGRFAALGLGPTGVGSGSDLSPSPPQSVRSRPDVPQVVLLPPTSTGQPLAQFPPSAAAAPAAVRRRSHRPPFHALARPLGPPSLGLTAL